MVSGDVLQELCSIKQAVARLVDGHALIEKPVTSCLIILQQIDSNAERKKSRIWKWSREGRLNPFWLNDDDKGDYVFKEEMLELAHSTEMLATRPDEPLENIFCFFYLLCGRNVSIRKRGFYEIECLFQHHCHFRENQELREKYSSGKVRGRDGRVLYGTKLEAEREFYTELDVPDLDYKRP